MEDLITLLIQREIIGQQDDLEKVLNNFKRFYAVATVGFSFGSAGVLLKEKKE